ncbi:hypothetical protein BU14_0126s0042 [Porphyra umbilicalis]|uniref:Uncharacterized protein n=1 Tax=Porphyra umbilicalis TaxID=2786 RepID=A0A1X6PBG8_PORUM|nr:hypothetical protein BU14_0126s0042 [Porphyra umbilicalis]|eukprot:OSX78003.1 hypothetical protein BU14_0126s0042 [Porphyra umbilicalis]
MAGAPRPLRFLVARWPPPPRVFDLRRVRRPLPPHSAVSAGRGGCFSLWGGRRSAGRPPPQRLLLFVLFLAAAAAVLTLSAVKDKDVLTHDYHKVKDKTAVVRVLGGVHVVSVRVSVAAVLSVGPEGGRAAAAGGPAGAAGVPPAVPPAGGRPLPLVAAAPAHHALLSPVERVARAAALLTRERPRAGALVALETAYVSGVTRAAPSQRLSALLADLTGAQVHAIVDVRLFGSVTAGTLASISVAAFSAAVATGATARVLTLLRGADPWGSAFLGSRWRAQLVADAAAAEAAARCRRRLTEQFADLAARTTMPLYLRASLESHYRGDLEAHAGTGGVVAASSAAARGGSGAASAAATAAAADTLAGGGAAASAAAHPAAAEPPSRHVWGTAAVGADVFASAAADATTAATPGDSAELAVATAAAAAIAAGGGAAEFTAAPPAAARPPPRHVSTPWRGGRRFHFDGRRRDVGGLARRLGRVCGGRNRPHMSASGEGLAEHRASPAAVASAATNPGGSSGLTAACAAAAANSAGGGHTILPATPLAIPPPFPRPGTATVVPDTGFVASAAGSAMDLSSDANPAAGELPAASASPTATVASATRPPPTAGAPAAAPPPRTAASGMDVDDPLAAATAADRQGGSAAAPPPAAAVAPPPAPTGSAPRPSAAATVSAAAGATTPAAAALPPPTARASARGGGAAAANLARRSSSAGGGPGVAKRRTRTTPAGLARALAAAGGSLLRGAASLPPPAGQDVAASVAASAANLTA